MSSVQLTWNEPYIHLMGNEMYAKKKNPTQSSRASRTPQLNICLAVRKAQRWHDWADWEGEKGNSVQVQRLVLFLLHQNVSAPSAQKGSLRFCAAYVVLRD